MINVVAVAGHPEQRRRLCDLTVGESGYAVPWAVDEAGNLDERFCVYPNRGGTVTMLVTAVAPGKYAIDYGNGN